MTYCGLGLVLLAAPLLLGYFIGEKKNRMWLNLGVIMGLVGIVIAILGMATQQ